MKQHLLIFILLLNSGSILWGQQPTPMATIKGGSYLPLYGIKDRDKTTKRVSLKSFKIDIYPVTNAQYKQFLEKYPEYRRSRLKGIFAEKSYLSQWKGDIDFGTLDAEAPVTNISWFAAKKYCECQGKRLPTMDEWEYVAQANATLIDARKEKSYQEFISLWLQTPKTYLNKVGSTPKNYWGVYDMHGLVWEWVSDFNSVFFSGEGRKDNFGDDSLFCGGGALNATDLTNYGAFMRYSLRGSLKANYTTINLGFRCASSNN
jgi:hypothetical protein